MTRPLGRQEVHYALLPHPKQDDFNKIPELQVCLAEALYDVDSIVADAGAYTNSRAYTVRFFQISNGRGS